MTPLQKVLALREKFLLAKSPFGVKFLETLHFTICVPKSANSPNSICTMQYLQNAVYGGLEPAISKLAKVL